MKNGPDQSLVAYSVHMSGGRTQGSLDKHFGDKVDVDAVQNLGRFALVYRGHFDYEDTTVYDVGIIMNEEMMV